MFLNMIKGPGTEADWHENSDDQHKTSGFWADVLPGLERNWWWLQPCKSFSWSFVIIVEEHVTIIHHELQSGKVLMENSFLYYIIILSNLENKINYTT